MILIKLHYFHCINFSFFICFFFFNIFNPDFIAHRPRRCGFLKPNMFVNTEMGLAHSLMIGQRLTAHKNEWGKWQLALIQ